MLPALPPGGRFIVDPVLLRGRLPTIGGLYQLANDVRKALGCLVEGDDASAWDLIATTIEGRIVRQFVRSQKQGEAAHYGFRDAIAGQDFRTYCFGLLAYLLAEGHAWRVAGCVQCGGFFLKTRRDPPDRPSRFCSEQCRRDWHNPRRAKKGG